jgi:hypothetical protein
VYNRRTTDDGPIAAVSAEGTGTGSSIPAWIMSKRSSSDKGGGRFVNILGLGLGGTGGGVDLGGRRAERDFPRAPRFVGIVSGEKVQMVRVGRFT